MNWLLKQQSKFIEKQKYQGNTIKFQNIFWHNPVSQMVTRDVKQRFPIFFYLKKNIRTNYLHLYHTNYIYINFLKKKYILLLSTQADKQQQNKFNKMKHTFQFSH